MIIINEPPLSLIPSKKSLRKNIGSSHAICLINLVKPASPKDKNIDAMVFSIFETNKTDNLEDINSSSLIAPLDNS